MIKRSNNQDTLFFTLELLRRIPQIRKISASELQVQLKDAGFERNIRTIQRQLELLSGRFGIESDERTKPYGYRWLEHSKGLSLPVLNEQESLLFSLAEEYLRDLLPVNLMKSMEEFFRQAKYNLGSQKTDQPDNEWLKKVRIVSTTQPLLAPEIDEGIFKQVSNALYGNKWLAIDYENASADRK